MTEKKKRDDAGFGRFAEVLYALPADLKTKIKSQVADEFIAVGRQRQLSLLFPDEKGGFSRSPLASKWKPAEYARPRGRKRRIAFGWYGGKFNHLSWLLPLLPQTHHYCEPFGGSAAVLLNREPAPVETFNDIDGDLVNFFRVLREQTADLIKAIALTPFSRRELETAVSASANGVSDLERARRFFVRARQVRTGLAQTASVGRWANCKKTSRAGMAGAVSRWLGSVQDLPEIAARLLRVQFENRPALEVIGMYDSKNTLFYCDPPYPHETRGDAKAYRFEMTEQDHTKLAQTLRHVKGKVAISGYRCDLMDGLYQGWRLVCATEKNCHSVKKPRVEALWMNY